MKRMLSITSLLSLSLFAISCGGGGEPEPDFESVSLEFSALVGDAAFSCEDTFQLGSAGTDVTFSDLKFYVHDVELVRSNGDVVPVTLDEDEVWQARGVALLDFEDRSGNCANGTEQTNTTITGKVDGLHDDYTGVNFTLGIPFELNHADVGALPSPLNLPTMFWSWQGGRKFLRLDGRVEDAGLRFHLGSTACQGEGNEVTNCANPNRADISLDGIDPIGSPIVFDIANLYENVNLSGSAENDQVGVCMSAPDSMSCVGNFGALGLPYGDSAGGDATAFRGME